MSELRFTWDPSKAAANVRKHRVTFEEAATVFDDPHAEPVRDNARSEERLLVIGRSAASRVLVVVCVEYIEDEVHIVSARRATKHERRRHEEGGW